MAPAKTRLESEQQRRYARTIESRDRGPHSHRSLHHHVPLDRDQPPWSLASNFNHPRCLLFRRTRIAFPFPLIIRIQDQAPGARRRRGTDHDREVRSGATSREGAVVTLETRHGTYTAGPDANRTRPRGSSSEEEKDRRPCRRAPPAVSTGNTHGTGTLFITSRCETLVPDQRRTERGLTGLIPLGSGCM